MSKKLDVEEILKKNPHIDEAKLEEGREFSEQLRNLGLRGKSYNLVSPGESRKARIVGSKGQRHTVYLPGRII